MESLKKCISGQISVSKKSLESITESFTSRKIKKGDYLLEAGKVCREMAFIETGYLRIFGLSEGKEITLWIGSEGKFITSVSSFVFETESYWNIQALTDCSLQVISSKKHSELLEKESKWLEFDNVLLANSFALLENRMFAHLHTTARERLESLFREEPELFNYVPLQHIASMIGIAPESLSRLRKKLMQSIS